jgi:hypothetical protein
MRKFILAATCVSLAVPAFAASQNYTARTQVAVNGCPGKKIPCMEWCEKHVKGMDVYPGCVRKCSVGPGATGGTPPCVNP